MVPVLWERACPRPRDRADRHADRLAHRSVAPAERPLLPENLSRVAHGQSLRRHPASGEGGGSLVAVQRRFVDAPGPGEGRHATPRIRPRGRCSRCRSRRSRCADPAVHVADPRVHDDPILAFTIGRNTHSGPACPASRSPGHGNIGRKGPQPLLHRLALVGRERVDLDLADDASVRRKRRSSAPRQVREHGRTPPLQPYAAGSVAGDLARLGRSTRRAGPSTNSVLR